MKKWIAIGLCLLLVAGTALAETASRVDRLAQGIVMHQLQAAGANSVQEWIDGGLTQAAGTGAEWYVIALSQGGTYDFSAYRRALQAYLEGRDVKSAVTRQKYALALKAAGASAEKMSAVAAGSVGQQGIMSWVYGLHLMNNGCTGIGISRETVVETLLQAQLPDGGWALNGTVADVDVTAMTLQALAAEYGSNEAVTTAVDAALQLLSQRQREDGGFASYGTPNPESAAQVMVALCALGVDCMQDDRFIKNGCTILDGMEAYVLSDGSVSHTRGGASNANATVQVLFALTAYQRMMAGKPGIYQLDGQTAVQLAPALGYKPVAVAVIAAAALAAGLALFLGKKRHPKNYLAVAVIAVLLVLLVVCTDVQSAGEYYGARSIAKENAIGTVTLEIRCDTVAGRTPALPQDGVILPETSFDIAQGDTVYTILTDAARSHGIHLESSGMPGMIYIAGMAQLYEFDYGDLSGWMMFVNGESPSVSCDQYRLSGGEKIQWLYTCEMGNDLK